MSDLLVHAHLVAVAACLAYYFFVHRGRQVRDYRARLEADTARMLDEVGRAD